MWEFETIGNGGGESVDFGDISWIVLDKAEDDGKMLLLSRQAFYEPWAPENQDEIEAHGGDFSWEASAARRFLNGRFIDEHFSEEEKARILEVAIENKGNPFDDAYEGASTRDRAFMLSLEEAVRYFEENPEAELFAILEEQVFYTRTPMFRKRAVSPVHFSSEEQWGELSAEFDYEDEGASRYDEIRGVFPTMSGLAENSMNAWVDVTESNIYVRPAMWVAC